MKKRIGLKDIAEKFNVSKAAVSKALKDSHDIGKEKREAIQAYAREIGYQPNIFAVGIQKPKTNTIGLILPNLLNHYFAKVFSGVEKIANQHGYNVIISVSNDLNSKEIQATEYFMKGTVDGFIVSLAEETQKINSYQHFKNVQNYDIGMVMIDRVSDAVLCDKVIVDDLNAGYEATKFFINRGRKNILLISKISNTSVGKHRIEGYKKALLENDIAIDEHLILKIGKHDDLETLLKITLGSREVNAILSLEETATIDSLELLKKQGYKVPDQISLIGFTNGELAQHASPRVTTVSQHGVFMGEQAMLLLLNRMKAIEKNSALDFETKTIKTSLIARDSTLTIK